MSDSDDALLVELRRRELVLRQEGWHPYAALLHFASKWRDVGVGVDAELWERSFDDFENRYRHGFAERPPAPGPFHEVSERRGRVLPLSRPPGALFELLHRRRSIRVFDPDAPVAAELLSTLLYETFGAQTFADLGYGVTVIGKTSGSSGARHPIEVYPLLLNVDGLDPGLYHYEVGRHALAPLAHLERSEAADVANTFAAGQRFIRDAAVVFVLAVRFYRSYWKYYRQSRNILALFADAGHLGQTFALVCTELGLGGFFTAAVNGANIEERLGLDGFREGAIALCVCGVPLPGDHALQPAWQRYVPNETEI